MESKISEKEWLEDFSGFVSSPGTPVPADVSEKILGYVRRELHPSPWLVFLKLLGIHLVVGTLSLAVCDQFGLNPFATEFSLAEYAMKLGHSFCMSFCGFFFVGLSVSMAGWLLKPEEFAALGKHSWMQIPSLGALSLGIMAALGAEIAFGIGVLWLLGALAGGFTPVLVRRWARA